MTGVNGPLAGVQLLAQRPRIVLGAFAIGARLGQHHRFRLDRSDRSNGVRPIGFDDRESARRTQCFHNIRRRAVCNNDERTLQRHGQMRTFFSAQPQPWQSAVNGASTAATASIRPSAPQALRCAAVAKSRDEDRVGAGCAECRLYRARSGRCRSAAVQQRVGSPRVLRRAFDAADRFLKMAERETISADAGDAGRRAGNDYFLSGGIDVAGIAGVDQTLRPNFEMGQAGVLDPGREGMVRDHRPADGKGTGFGSRKFGDHEAVRRSRGTVNRPKRNGARLAIGVRGVAGTIAVSPKMKRRRTRNLRSAKPGSLASCSGERHAAITDIRSSPAKMPVSGNVKATAPGTMMARHR